MDDKMLEAWKEYPAHKNSSIEHCEFAAFETAWKAALESGGPTPAASGEMEDRLEGMEIELCSALGVIHRSGDADAQRWLFMNWPKEARAMFLNGGETLLSLEKPNPPAPKAPKKETE